MAQLGYGEYRLLDYYRVMSGYTSPKHLAWFIEQQGTWRVAPHDLMDTFCAYRKRSKQRRLAMVKKYLDIFKAERACPASKPVVCTCGNHSI